MTEHKTQPATPLWQLRYTLTREDIAAFEFLPRELVGLEKLWVLGPILAFGAAAGYFQDWFGQFVPWDPETKLGQLASVLTAIAAGYLASLVLLTARTRRRIARAKLPDGPVTFAAFPDDFEAGQPGKTRTLRWSDVRVIATGTHVFLCPQPREAVIVPARAFADLDEFRRFEIFAKTRGSDPGDGHMRPPTSAYDKENRA